MFVTIETKGATHVAIYVPHSAAEKSLPAIAAMLENNATFICRNYHDQSIVVPVMGITLGDSITFDNNETPITVAANGAVIADDFELASPEIFTSNKAAIRRKDDDIAKLRTELAFVKSELATVRDALAALSGSAAESC